MTTVFGPESSCSVTVLPWRIQRFWLPACAVHIPIEGGALSRLVPIANRWNQALRLSVRYPQDLADSLLDATLLGSRGLRLCLLRYGQDDYNCLHQDVYAEHFFSLQATVLLSRPGVDFTGGEFVLTEQRPRMQSRVEVVPLEQGDAVVFAVQHRPVPGKRGFYRVSMRHGVSRVRSGTATRQGSSFTMRRENRYTAARGCRA
ncbi:2OG-Fe(II) oxygenase [Pseudomonas sp. MTM4]|nr:2OG-Fe(II) oxygenase [Pseudomonas sp. MTM4]